MLGKLQCIFVGDLMNKSMIAWNRPRNQLSEVIVPRQNIRPSHNTGKITWDHINYTKQTVSIKRLYKLINTAST